MNVSKIGVLTFHRCINYGSYWQARCLAEGLQALGYDVEILDHYSRSVNFSEWKCAYRPVLPTHVPESDYPLYGEKIQRFFSAFDELPLSPRFPLNDPRHMENYDVVVVGSDEVWNMFHPWYGKNALFFGDGIKAERLISFAASFGNYPASWGVDETWAEKLRNFDAISVRDANSQTIIKNALDVEPTIVLDPCLLFSINKRERSIHYLPEKYMAVYGHNFSDYFIREITRYAKHNRLQLISIGYRNDWADEQWITADPHDFANFIANADAVVTNFFHGCVFALRNAKPFVCETTPYRSIKVHNLLTQLNAENYLVNEETPSSIYATHLTEPLSEHVFAKINLHQQISYEYLDEALNNKQLQIA